MRIYQNSVQLIGLGSAGTNIVEAFLTDKKTKDLIQNDLTRLSLLALDIADPEIRSLQEANDEITRSMIKAGIPQERLRVVAESVKFPTAEAMFDFINQKYGDCLINEGSKLQNFVPWLNSTMAIPPMAGGAGRRRALAKAIYALNYYQLGIIRNCINVFKEQALSSIITPTVILVYGLGGGTGSGLSFDFARHLRKVLGSGVPIIGLVITPCGGDDPPAKGCSAFVAMNELSLLLNKDYNEHICKVYGDYYRNPLNALIYLPLLPAFSKVGNIVSARREMDKMVVDLLYVLMDFDLADLMGGVGTEVGLTNNSAHTLGMLKVSYPVEDYIAAFKLSFERTELLQQSRQEKLEILKEIENVIQRDNEVVRELFKNYLIKSGTFEEEQFEEKLKTVINSNPRLEEDQKLHVKGVEIQAKDWLDDTMSFLSTIKLMGKIGPIEEAIINLTLRKDGSRKLDNLEALLTTLTKNHLEFYSRKGKIIESLKQLIPSSQIFTLRQKRVLEDVVNMAEIAERSLKILKFYDETRYLTDALMRYYEVIPESKLELEELKDIKSELSTIYLIIQLMLRTPSDEAKMIDEHMTYVNEILAKRMRKRANVESDVLIVQESKKRKEFDKQKLDQAAKKLFSSKRYIREQLLNVERDIRKLTEEEAIATENLDKADATIKLYEKLVKRFELISEYRKRLNQIVDLQREYSDKMAQITSQKPYFEKCAELTQKEQLKIVFKILTEQEELLTRDVIVKDILDIDHLKDYMKSVVRAFKTPSIMGYKPSYKTDYIWITVSSPPNMWTEDMSQELYTSLAGYVTSEVSKTVTVRVIESRDPWTTRVMVVGGRGKAEDMEAYDEMQSLFNKSNEFERYLSRSYLLEHGVHSREIVKELNGNNHNNINNKKSQS